MRDPIITGDIATIPLTKGKSAIVDTASLEIVGGVRWHFIPYSDTGYAGTTFTKDGKRKVIRMHRAILSPPDDKEVDHINGDGLDNRLANLRIVSREQNQRNSKRRSDNTSGFKGVSLHGKSGKWQARIRIDGKQKSLGIFRTKEEAHKAYCDASKKYHGEYGRVL